MCGRYHLVSSPALVAELLGLHRIVGDAQHLRSRYNIAPGQPVAIVRALRPGDTDASHALQLSPHPNRPLSDLPCSMSLASWGFIPRWAREDDIGVRTINVCCRTIDSKPVFREAFRRRRCLIPADGLYEWSVGEDGRRQPMCIRVKVGPAADTPVPFAMAGLWDTWYPYGVDRPGPAVETCTIITAPSNGFMRGIHERTPVILRQQEYRLWLDPANEDISLLNGLCRSCDSELLQAYPVSAMVNSPRNDSPQCAEPAAFTDHARPF